MPTPDKIKRLPITSTNSDDPQSSRRPTIKQRAVFHASRFFAVRVPEVARVYHPYDIVIPAQRGQHPLYLGSAPRREQKFPAELQTVVSLLEEWEHGSADNMNAADWLKHQTTHPTFTFRHHPMGDFGTTGLNHAEAKELSDLIKSRLALGSVWVHCKAGKGRSWTVTLCYAMEHGYSEENNWFNFFSAMLQIQTRRPAVSPNIEQINFAWEHQLLLLAANTLDATAASNLSARLNFIHVFYQTVIHPYFENSLKLANFQHGKLGRTRALELGAELMALVLDSTSNLTLTNLMNETARLLATEKYQAGKRNSHSLHTLVTEFIEHPEKITATSFTDAIGKLDPLLAMPEASGLAMTGRSLSSPP